MVFWHMLSRDQQKIHQPIKWSCNKRKNGCHLNKYSHVGKQEKEYCACPHYQNQNPKQIRISKIIYAVDEQIKTLNCKRESKKGCNGKTIKCITHNLWDDLENHINDFFDKVSLSDVIKQRNAEINK